MLNKKRIITIIGVLLIVIAMFLLGSFLLGSKPDVKVENVGGNATEEEVAIETDKQKNNILVLDEYGLITLYDADGKVLDTKDVYMDVATIPTEVTTPGIDEELIASYVNIENSNRKVESVMEDGILRVFDSSGVEVRRFDMSSMVSSETVDVNDAIPSDAIPSQQEVINPSEPTSEEEELIKDALGAPVPTRQQAPLSTEIASNAESEMETGKPSSKEETKIEETNTEEADEEEINEEETDVEEFDIVHIQKVESFEALHLSDGKLIYMDTRNNILYDISVIENAIEANIVLKGYNLNNLKSVAMNDSNIYLTYFGENTIREIPREFATKGNINSDNVRMLNPGDYPDFILADGESLYYTTSDKFGQYNVSNGASRTIDIGDETLDLFIDDKYVYVVNAFGRGLDNSILIKIDKNSLMVDNILQLQGLNSDFIGMGAENTAYFRQTDSIKSVDLEQMKAKFSYKMKSNMSMHTEGELFYSLNNDVVKAYDITDRENAVMEFPVNGDYLYIIR